MCPRVGCCCLVAKVCLTLLYPTRLLSAWDFPGKNTGVGFHFLPPGDLSDPGIKPVSPASTGGCFTTEPVGKPPEWDDVPVKQEASNSQESHVGNHVAWNLVVISPTIVKKAWVSFKRYLSRDGFDHFNLHLLLQAWHSQDLHLQRYCSQIEFPNIFFIIPSF